MNNYKLIYERDGKIFGSLCGIPAPDDALVPELNELFGIKLPESKPVFIAETLEDVPEKSIKSKSKKSKDIVEAAPVAEEIDPENILSVEITE